jgi:hypothetical protein
MGDDGREWRIQIQYFEFQELKVVWLPGIFLVRTIVDACADTTSPIIYVGDFKTWSEEAESRQAIG